MASPRHLGHNWYLFEVNDKISDWILSCLSEEIDFVQPYDKIYIRARRTLNGQCQYKAVFSGIYDDRYRFPVCYLLDLNTGKFKGNKMHYCIDPNGTHYADKFPVYSDRFKFDRTSRYYREEKILWQFLNGLHIPAAFPSSKEKRRIIRTYRTNLANNVSRCGYRRKKKKHNLRRDFKLELKSMVN